MFGTIVTPNSAKTNHDKNANVKSRVLRRRRRRRRGIKYGGHKSGFGVWRSRPARAPSISQGTYIYLHLSLRR